MNSNGGWRAWRRLPDAHHIRRADGDDSKEQTRREEPLQLHGSLACRWHAPEEDLRNLHPGGQPTIRVDQRYATGRGIRHRNRLTRVGIARKGGDGILRIRLQVRGSEVET